jgi:hypothetical protein
MTASFAGKVRTGALSVTTATALAAALSAAPAGHADAPSGTPASAPTAVAPTAAAAARPGLVTLVTGDRVLVRHDASGRLVASVAPGSPHYGKPVEFVHTPDHAWLIPKLAPSIRQRFDTSVFDVAALARSRRVPLRVTFDRGAVPRSLPGLDVRPATARGVRRGQTTVRASYDPHRALPAALASSLRGVAHVSVIRPAAALPSGYVLHTLTINATTVRGAPLPDTDVFVTNADDARLFDFDGGLHQGKWKVSVPPGHYDVVVSDFSHLVVRQVTVGDADTTTSISMAAATVKPHMPGPHHFTSLDPELDVEGTDEAGHGGWGFGFGGVLPKVAPIRHVAAGALHTEVSNVWGPKGYQPITFHHGKIQTHPIRKVVAGKRVRKSIPHDLTFPFHQRDYADVAVRHYATGPHQRAWDGWAAFSRIDTGLLVPTFPTARPGVVHARLLGRRDLVWDSSTTVDESFRHFTELDQTARYHRGQQTTIPFFRGPVTPVADRGGESTSVRRSCGLCVIDGEMGGYLAMFASAGTAQAGLDDHGHFALFHGGRRVSHGSALLTPFVAPVKAGERFRMVAKTTPVNRKHVLSATVRDTWRFRVPARRRAIVPILRAAYVPPTNLHSVGPAGRVHFPITFDNLGPVDARVTHASVRWSSNGKRWHAAQLTRRDKNTFGVSYVEPRGTKAHRYLSLKVFARDAAGRTIKERVANAYVLPHTAPKPSRPGHSQRHGSFHPGNLCGTPTKHRYACSVELNAHNRSARKAADTPKGWGASALRSAYGLEGLSGGDTVGIVVAYDYPHAVADMNHYRAQYGLPACTHASGCFTKINQNGGTSYPAQDYDWGVEASLDLQMVSTACPTCHIVLVEANQPDDASFFKAEQAAVDAGATVTNHSFGRIELTGAQDDALHFVHTGVTAVASTGDDGYGPAHFPASSPDVVAVGGTVLSRASNARHWAEKAWDSASSGCSAYFPKPAGQQDRSCAGRTIADVSAVARKLAIYNTSLPKRYRGWLTVDGTSASSPLISGMIASVGGAGLRPTDLYGLSRSAFNDVVGGSNGYCRGNYLCTGLTGYDGPTGLGSPVSPDTFGP